MIFWASAFASAFEPCAVSCLAMVMAPSWWLIIMVRNCLSNAAPVAAVSVAISASLIMPGIAPLSMPGMAEPMLVLSAGLPHAASHAFMVSISGCCAVLILAARSFTW